MFTEIFDWIQNTELAFQIGATWWFPFIESLHVVAVTLVVGSIAMVDLRILCLTAASYTVERFSAELTRWAWCGFALALLTGLGMFISRPAHYAANPAFQIKLGLLALIGLNLLAYRGLKRWSSTGAVLSLLFWVGVVVAGRWTGHLN